MVCKNKNDICHCTVFFICNKRVGMFLKKPLFSGNFPPPLWWFSPPSMGARLLVPLQFPASSKMCSRYYFTTIPHSSINPSSHGPSFMVYFTHVRKPFFHKRRICTSSPSQLHSHPQWSPA